MTIHVDWTFLIQSRLKLPVGDWFRRHEVETYDEAVALLQKNNLPVGSREDMAKHIPIRPEINDLLFDTGSTTTSVAGRLAKKKVDKGPKSAAEEAADAITASSAAKTVAPKKDGQKHQSTRTRATTPNQCSKKKKSKK